MEEEINLQLGYVMCPINKSTISMCVCVCEHTKIKDGVIPVSKHHSMNVYMGQGASSTYS